MVIDVVGAVAIIPVALGTVAELHIGVVLVGEAAYRALVQVAAGLPGLLLGLPLGLLEVDDLGVRPAAGKAQLHGPEGPGEDEVVDKAGQGQQDHKRAALHPLQQDKGHVQQGQPLHFDGEHEHEQHLHLAVHGGDDQEEGQVDVIDAGSAQKQAARNGQRRPAQVEQAELDRPPLPLQHLARPIDHIAAQQQVKGIAAAGDQNEGEQPPDLPPKNQGAVEEQEVGQRTPEKQVQDTHGRLADGNIHGQVGYAQPGMLGAETVNRTVMVVAVHHGQVSFSLVDTILPHSDWKIINKL